MITSTDLASPFVRSLMVMRYTGEGHVTVTNQARTVRAPGRPTKREIISPADTVKAVRDLGVRLDDDEAARLAAIVARIRTGGDANRSMQTPAQSVIVQS
ncbi:hypothetical protein [Antrihabitans cavernicola]|uniref:Uncharacterized protein n=1 Tax=Antrihabitans cavernicola TaxID=2495913 RepID=A0A5A7S531_9NOCA|nr:hypothetical protein [Spelaeibacter cavernicola]KAA0017669.1 hypothetical protein FOY51_24855 [Spelaeibacter cavernicola]